MEITVVQGDITQQNVDAVVNAANERMRGGGGVDGAIHRAGGPEVLEDCIAKVPDGERLPTGQARATTSGNMRQRGIRWVVHVVGPVYVKDEEKQRERRALLESCYENALRVADELGARSIAFPLVSAGVYGWPREDAIRVAVDTLRATPTSVEEARLVAFDSAAYDAMMAALRT